MSIYRSNYTLWFLTFSACISIHCFIYSSERFTREQKGKEKETELDFLETDHLNVLDSLLVLVMSNDSNAIASHIEKFGITLEFFQTQAFGNALLDYDLEPKMLRLLCIQALLRGISWFDLTELLRQRADFDPLSLSILENNRNNFKEFLGSEYVLKKWGVSALELAELLNAHSFVEELAAAINAINLEGLAALNSSFGNLPSNCSSSSSCSTLTTGLSTGNYFGLQTNPLIGPVLHEDVQRVKDITEDKSLIIPQYMLDDAARLAIPDKWINFLPVFIARYGQEELAIQELAMLEIAIKNKNEETVNRLLYFQGRDQLEMSRSQVSQANQSLVNNSYFNLDLFKSDDYVLTSAEVYNLLSQEDRLRIDVLLGRYLDDRQFRGLPENIQNALTTIIKSVIGDFDPNKSPFIFVLNNLPAIHTTVLSPNSRISGDAITKTLLLCVILNKHEMLKKIVNALAESLKINPKKLHGVDIGAALARARLLAPLPQLPDDLRANYVSIVESLETLVRLQPNAGATNADLSIDLAAFGLRGVLGSTFNDFSTRK